MKKQSVPPIQRVERARFTRSGVERGPRAVPEEDAIAFTFDRATYAVMMATPADLEDFAIGFSLTEGIVTHAEEIAELEIVPLELGIELRMSLANGHGGILEKRRRNVVGPAGCGLCGIESLEAVMRDIPPVPTGLRVPPEAIFRAMIDLGRLQPLNGETHATHAAGFWSIEDDGFVAVREDVGRHNALDKLAGALARSGCHADRGFLALTSRISIELVQKAASIGCPLLAAVSAPTAFAVRAAEEAGLTLVAIAREDSFEVFTHVDRIAGR